MVSSQDPLWSLALLNGWTLSRDGQRQKVAHRQQRLITALVLLGERPRTFLAGLLWPDSSDAQAAVGLRVSIWHINHELPGLLDADGTTEISVALSEKVKVDITDLERELQASASELSDSYPRWERLRTAELLPGWYEDWILVEQERFRALRTAALDSVAAYHLSQGNAEETKAATTLAIALEPFRESSYRLLIQAHLATGDLVSALRIYRSFSAELRQEFGVGPSPSLAKLIAGAVGASGRQMDFGGLPLTKMLPVASPRDHQIGGAWRKAWQGTGDPKTVVRRSPLGAEACESKALTGKSAVTYLERIELPDIQFLEPANGKSAETVSPGKNVAFLEPSSRPNDALKRAADDTRSRSNDPRTLRSRNRIPRHRILPAKTSSAVKPTRISPGPGRCRPCGRRA